jgi:hypothetical protein
MSSPENQEGRDGQGSIGPEAGLVLYAFDELPADQKAWTGEVLSEDRRARATVEAMRRLGELVRKENAGPTDRVVAATRASICIGLNRRRRRRRIRTGAAAASVAAVAAVVLLVVRPPHGTRSVPAVVDASKPAVSQSSAFVLSEEDRQAIRQTVARMVQERDWQDSLDDEVEELQLRLNTTRSSAYRSESTPRRYAILRQRMEELSGDMIAGPRSTRPAGSSRDEQLDGTPKPRKGRESVARGASPCRYPHFRESERAFWSAAAATPLWLAAEPPWLVSFGSAVIASSAESQNAPRRARAASLPPHSKWPVPASGNPGIAKENQHA